MPPNRNNGNMQGSNMPVCSSRIRRSSDESEEKQKSTAPKQNTANAPPPLTNIFESLFGKKTPDIERIILVVLIILLAKDGADLTLLIALGYLLI